MKKAPPPPPPVLQPWEAGYDQSKPDYLAYVISQVEEKLIPRDAAFVVKKLQEYAPKVVSVKKEAAPAKKASPPSGNVYLQRAGLDSPVAVAGPPKEISTPRAIPQAL